MKRTFTTFALLSALAGTAQAADVTVQFTGLQDVRGELYIALYPSAEAMKNHHAVQSQIVAVHKANQRTVLADLPAGEYGVMVFQDLDGNHDLNSNLLGIPTEPYGFSTNPRVMGPPSFSDIQFSVNDANVNLTINME